MNRLLSILIALVLLSGCAGQFSNIEGPPSVIRWGVSGDTIYPIGDKSVSIDGATVSGSVSTYAAARLLDVTDFSSGDVIYIKSRATMGDGGEGYFRVVTGAAASTYTDDGGVTLLPSGGDGSAAFIRLFTDKTLLPEWWGAVGNDSADDTSAIASTMLAGYSVYLSKGKTYLSDAITISANNVSVIGHGCLKLNDSQNTAFVTITGDNVTLDGIEIDGNRANNSAGSTVYATSADSLTVKNCVIHDAAATGLVLRGGNHLKVINNTFYDNVFQQILANSEDEAMTDVKISSNVCYVTADSINTNGGISCYAAANSITAVNIVDNQLYHRVENIVHGIITVYGNVSIFTITGNTTHGGGIGISVAGAYLGTCTGNEVYQPQDIGIEIATGGTGFDSSDITVVGNSIAGIDSAGGSNTKGVSLSSTEASSSVKHCNISSNRIKDCYQGISVAETSSGSIEDISVYANQITIPSNSGIGIRAVEVEKLSIKANHIDHNGKTTVAGVKIEDCDKFSVEDNFMFGGVSGDYGILLAGSSVDITYGDVKNNSYEGAGTAIILSGYIRYTGDSNTVDITGPLEIRENLGRSTFTAASGDGNPSAVYFGPEFFLSGSSTVTDFLHDYIGAEITIRSSGTPTIQDNSAIVLAGGADFVMSADDIIVLKCFSAGVWTEISRSVN